MKIENKTITEKNYLGKVTYVPSHALGKGAGHEDCEQGVIIRCTDYFVWG
jgi:hypothetical protein